MVYSDPRLFVIIREEKTYFKQPKFQLYIFALRKEKLTIFDPGSG